MDARLRMTDGGYGEEPAPTGEIEVWDNDKFEWRLATESETVPALLQLVVGLYRWKQRALADR